MTEKRDDSAAREAKEYADKNAKSDFNYQWCRQDFLAGYSKGREARDGEIAALKCPETNEEWLVLAKDHARLTAQLAASEQARERLEGLVQRYAYEKGGWERLFETLAEDARKEG